jgi:tripartite-type tricarboxylate transporter receptor subunit TctC
LAKRSPGQIAYATPGVGTPHDLAGLLMMQKAGIKLNAITYKGNGPALADLLAGHVQIGMFTISNVLPYVQAGKLKALAVVGDQRTKLAPEIPSMRESGLAGVDVSSRYVMLAPAGTPPAAIAKLHAAIEETVKKPETVQTFNKLGYEPMSVSEQEAASMLKAERERWQPVLKAANIKPE